MGPASGASETRESRFRSHTLASRSRPFPEISKTTSGINIIIPIDAGLETGATVFETTSNSRFRSATVFSRSKSFPEISEFHYHEDRHSQCCPSTRVGRNQRQSKRGETETGRSTSQQAAMH